jgi:hypothetical protein
MFMVFAGYAVGLWGYCLVRGYNVTFADVFKTEWPGGGASGTNKNTGNAKAA